MQQYEEDEITIDLRELLQEVKRNIPIVRKVTLGCIAAAALYLLVVPPTFESTAILRIQDKSGSKMGGMAAMLMGGGGAKGLPATYEEMLKGRSVVEPLIKEMEEADSDGKYPRYETYIEGKRIVTEPVKGSELLSVTYTAKTAEDAQKGAKILLNNFMNHINHLSRDHEHAVRVFLEERLTEAKKELTKAEDDINNYQKEHKIITPDASVAVVSEKLILSDKAKAENKLRQAEGQALAAASDKFLKGNAARIADSTAIKAYNNKLAELEAERIKLASRYTEKHPSMIKINQDIAELQAKLDEAIAAVADGKTAANNDTYTAVLAGKFKGESEATVAQSNLDAIKRLEEEYKGDIEKLTDEQRKFLELKRHAAVAGEVYKMLSQRLEQAKIDEVAAVQDVQIVENPNLPEKRSKPKRALTLILATLLGIIASSGYVVGKFLMNPKVRNNDDIATNFGLPVLGEIPSVESLQEAAEVAPLNTRQKLWRLLWKK